MCMAFCLSLCGLGRFAHTYVNVFKFSSKEYNVYNCLNIQVSDIENMAIIAVILFSWPYPDSKVHGANMGPTWVLLAPDGPHVGPKILFSGYMLIGLSFLFNFESNSSMCLFASSVKTKAIRLWPVQLFNCFHIPGEKGNISDSKTSPNSSTLQKLNCWCGGGFIGMQYIPNWASAILTNLSLY